MSQEFHVLKCFSCDMFQVHQIKKDRKWACKVCTEKQSLKKAFFRGSAKHCRLTVQKINRSTGEQRFEKQALALEELEVENEIENSSNYETVFEKPNNEEKNSETYGCPPFKKQKKSEYAPSLPEEMIVKPSSLNIHSKPQALPELGSTASSVISFNLAFDEYVSPSIQNHNFAVKVKEYDNKDNLSVKPKVSKNRGFQRILKALKESEEKKAEIDKE